MDSGKQSVIVSQLIRDGYLKTPEIINAFLAVPRERFLPEAEKDNADLNVPLPIGYGQTNSQPLTVAFMIELLQPKAGESVLDVGAGSGWTAALFAHLVGQKGTVRAVERIPQLYRFAKENVSQFHYPQLELVSGDATREDPTMPEYDVIHVAAAARILPKVLQRRLSIGGRMIVPVGEGLQTLILLTRNSKTDFLEQRFPGFSFVPLLEGPLS
jgi:protein-L-isoaspartate(D-aspartate) O-methyltransferase